MKRLATILTILWCLYCTPVLGQDDRLVSMLRVFYGDELDRVGAAIVVAHDRQSTTLVTAAHTVIDEGFGGSQKITVEFLALPQQQFKADVALIHASPELDLAVLVVKHDAESAHLPEFEEAKSTLYPEAIFAEAGDSTYAIGFPGERPWFGNRRPDIIREVSRVGEGQFISYASSVTTPGMSGGGLFSEHGTLLGMVLDVSATAARALDIATIQSVLGEEDIDFHLKENTSVFASLADAELQRQGNKSNSALGQILVSNRPDLNVLHLFWIAGYETERLEDLLATRISSGEKTYAEVVIENMAQSNGCKAAWSPDNSDRISNVVRLGISNVASSTSLSTCHEHMLLWFRQSLSNGLNPDLILALDETRSESLLAIALEKTAADAALALLEFGAAPNPYVNLDGLWKQRSRFTHPLDYVLDNFSGKQQDLLWNAFDSASVVTINEIEGIGDRILNRVEATDVSVIPENCNLRSALTKFDWCDIFTQIPRNTSILVSGGGDPLTGRVGVKLTHLLFADEERVYLAGTWTRSGFRERIDVVVVEFSRTTFELSSFRYGNEYGCRERKDGSAPSYCWRKRDAKSSSALVKTARPKKPEGSNGSAILQASAEGIGLSMSRDDAIKILQDKSYQLKTRGNPADYPDRILTLPFEKFSDGEWSTFSLITLNSDILGLRHFRRPEKLLDDRILPNVAKPIDPDWVESVRTHKKSMSYFIETNNPVSAGLAAVDDNGDQTIYLQKGDHLTANYGFLTLIFARQKTETLAEASFWNSKLASWFPEPRPATKTSPCLDEYKWVRGSAGQGCLTRAEFGSKFLAGHRESDAVTVLPSGIQYEFLERGDGESFAPNHVVNYMQKTSSAGDVDASYSGSGGARLDMDTIKTGWVPFIEIISTLRVGDKIRVVIPPGAWDVPNLPANRRATVPIIYETHFYSTVSK